MSDGDGHTCYLFDGIPYTVMNNWSGKEELVIRDWHTFGEWLACGLECYTLYRGIYTFERLAPYLSATDNWYDLIMYFDAGLKEAQLSTMDVVSAYSVKHEEDKTIDLYFMCRRRALWSTVMCALRLTVEYGQEPMFEIKVSGVSVQP